MRKAVLVVFLGFLFSFPQPANSARNIHILSDKGSLTGDEELNITASVSGFLSGDTLYLKGAFYKEGSSNYFGLTKFNDSWVKNSVSAGSQKEVSIGQWDNSLSVKVDYTDNGFSGIGDYRFKLGYYYVNSSGNLSSVNWSSNYINIMLKSEPTPTPTVNKTNSNSSNSKNNSSGVSSTPTLSNNLSGENSIPSNVTPRSVKISNARRAASEYAKIKPIVKTKKVEEDNVQVLGTNEMKFPQVFLIFGGVLLIFSVLLFLKRELKERNIL